MRRFLFPAALAVGLAFMPSTAQASWLSEALHRLRGDYPYPAHYGDYVAPGYYDYGYVSPGYSVDPGYYDYGYVPPDYYGSYYTPGVYGYGSYYTPGVYGYGSYRPYWYSPRYYGGYGHHGYGYPWHGYHGHGDYWHHEGHHHHHW